MSWAPRAVLFLSLVGTSACQSDKGGHQHAEDTPFARDIDRICHAEEHSGALEIRPGGRAVHVGKWLATNLESQEARDLSAWFVQAKPEERIARLKELAKEHGIADCAMVRAWGGETE